MDLPAGEMLRGKQVMDVGSGLGIDCLTLAQAGAKMTFVDITQENLQVLRRLCRAFDLTEVDFYYLEDFSSLDALPRNFDAIWCQGSMINAPFDFMRRECALLLQHLPVGGRWIELCYPYERWEREGGVPFSKWGEMTDGEGTPWMEWYDLERLLERLRVIFSSWP
jgi:SAM-dependent methyltransferase